MLKVSNFVDVNATREDAWDLLSDFEGVWENSNPAHRGTKVLSEPKRPLRDGLRWWQREKVGLVQGEFVATLHDVVPEREFSWTAIANYRLLGISFTVDEGGRFVIEERNHGIALRHDLWGKFRETLKGQILRWIAVHLLQERQAMASHNLIELRYFKDCLEHPA
ncbi:MAG: SRPBCC family protein [Elainellaceae cyanobacterium]